jgi:P-type Cu+ transporter
MTGACGIAAGTPLAIVGGLGSAAKHGVVIRGGHQLEALSTVRTVVFDKTGTLTEGRPRVTDHYIAQHSSSNSSSNSSSSSSNSSSNSSSGSSSSSSNSSSNSSSSSAELSFLRTVHAVESRCEHPIAHAAAAFAAAALQSNNRSDAPQSDVASDVISDVITDFSEETGRGVTCSVNGRSARIGSAAFLAKELQAAAGDTSLHTWRTRHHAASTTGTIHSSSSSSSRRSAASEVFVAVDGQLIGALLVQDAVKAEAASVVAALQQQGLNVVIMSGDGAAAVSAVAAQLGVTTVYSELSPLDKTALIQDMLRQGDKVCVKQFRDTETLHEQHPSGNSIGCNGLMSCVDGYDQLVRCAALLAYTYH